jgi:hypothetical protein
MSVTRSTEADTRVPQPSSSKDTADTGVRHGPIPPPALGLPSHIADDWVRLRDTARPARRFDPDDLERLPEPVRRWLTQAIEPGALLCNQIELEMRGEIRIGRWMPFTATQVLAPPDGFIWAARAHVGPLSMVGFDRYTSGVGEMRWSIAGRIPMIRSSGRDITRSALGRLAGEASLNPACALAPWMLWTPVDDHCARYTMTDGSDTTPVTVHVDHSGRLTGVHFERWGKPNRHGYRFRQFGVHLDGTMAAGGLSFPQSIDAGWDWDGAGTSINEFFRAEITAVRVGVPS